jgi:hypothetical protein
MTKPTKQLLGMLDELISDLSGPLAADDREEGWDDDMRDEMRQNVVGLRARLRAGRGPAHGEPHHLVRWLGYDGVVRGPLVSRFADVQRKLRDEYSMENGTAS